MCICGKSPSPTLNSKQPCYSTLNNPLNAADMGENSGHQPISN